jgi:cystathionine beta-lyase
MPEATYLAWLDFRMYRLDMDPAEFLRRSARVVASSGADAGLGGEGFVRFNFAMPARLLERSVEAIGAALRSARLDDSAGALAAGAS